MDFSSFLIKIILIILITFSIQEKINPIPEGNGILNAEYNHQNDENNLFFIFLTFRHGARSSLYFIEPNKDMFEGIWESNSQLTNYGKKQHYELGLKYQKRYSNFINYDYDPKEILIYSTNFERTINSVSSQLLGLYNNISFLNLDYWDFQNNEKEEINSIIPPINLFTLNENNNIKYNKYESIFKGLFNCKSSRKKILKNYKKPNKVIKNFIKNFMKEYSKIITKEYKKINITYIKTARGFEIFCDCIISIYYDEKQRHILKGFEKYGKNVTKVKELCDNYTYNVFVHIRNGEYAKNNAFITMTPVFKKMLNWMYVRIDKNNNFASEYLEPKFVIFSGHDSTLFEMQHFLKKSFDIDYEYTPFASTQLYEVRKYGDLFYVELYFNDKLKMNITYQEFKNEVEKLTMSEKDIYNICHGTKKELYRKYKIIFLIIIVIVLLFIICFITLKIYKMKYSELNKEKIIQIA